MVSDFTLSYKPWIESSPVRWSISINYPACVPRGGERNGRVTVEKIRETRLSTHQRIYAPESATAPRRREENRFAEGTLPFSGQRRRFRLEIPIIGPTKDDADVKGCDFVFREWHLQKTVWLYRGAPAFNCKIFFFKWYQLYQLFNTLFEK